MIIKIRFKMLVNLFKKHTDFVFVIHATYIINPFNSISLSIAHRSHSITVKSYSISLKVHIIHKIINVMY